MMKSLVRISSCSRGSLRRCIHTAAKEDSSVHPHQHERGGLKWVALGGTFMGLVAAGKRAEDDKEWRDSLPNGAGQVLVDGMAKARMVVQDAKQMFSSDLIDKVKDMDPKSLVGSVTHSAGPKLPAYRMPQEGVLSMPKHEAVFLTIHLDKKYADYQECASAVAQAVSEYKEKSGGKISCVIGFSDRVWESVQSKLPAGMPIHPFEYQTRKGGNGASLPATGGDIFLQGKCEDRNCSRGELFLLARKALEAIPVESIQDAEDVYGFQYENGRDLTGFKSCSSANTQLTEDEMANIALVPSTGGTYALAQVWRHKMYEFDELPQPHQEAVIGKVKKTGNYIGDGAVNLKTDPSKLATAIEHGLPESSHVAKVIGVDQNSKRLSILRQSMPIGNLAPGPVGKDNIHEPGLFFLAYANDPLIFEYMLERMMGHPIRSEGVKTSTASKRSSDEILRYNMCLRGQLYYIPSLQQLRALEKLV